MQQLFNKVMELARWGQEEAEFLAPKKDFPPGREFSEPKSTSVQLLLLCHFFYKVYHHHKASREKLGATLPHSGPDCK